MSTYYFNADRIKEELIQWIRDFFENCGKDCNAIIGISGGKDSSVTAALCVEALGKERVIGVLMPCGEQSDIDMARMLVETLDIKSIEVNIKDAVEGVYKGIEAGNAEFVSITRQTRENLPARIRMSTLYAISQSCNGRVVNTCNLSEDWVGYSTRYGDAAGDFSPLAKLTVTEVKQIGKMLGLPQVLIDKTPTDGLCGKSDEENLGFTYSTLDKYIRMGICEDSNIKADIDKRHWRNMFKLEMMPMFDPGINIAGC